MFQPYSRGVCKRWLRLAPKTNAIAIAAMPRVTLISVVRTGTAVAPRPGSNAILVPTVMAGPGLSALMPLATRERRARPDGCGLVRDLAARRAARHEGHAAIARTRTTMHAPPRAMLERSTWKPG